MKLHQFLDKHPQYKDKLKENLKEQEFKQAMRARHLSSITSHGLVFVKAPENIEGPISVEVDRNDRSTTLTLKPVL